MDNRYEEVKSWRRDPIGAGLRVLSHRKRSAQIQMLSRVDIMDMEPDQYEDKLRSEGASEKMIAQEVAEFKKLRAEREIPEKELREKMDARRNRVMTEESLTPYIEAEIRRVSGISADEIIEEIRNEENS